MYRRRVSNKTLSGRYAHLNGQQLTWEESLDSEQWYPMSGIIKRVGDGGKCFFVEDKGTSALHWVDPIYTARYRNIQIM